VVKGGAARMRALARRPRWTWHSVQTLPFSPWHYLIKASSIAGALLKQISIYFNSIEVSKRPPQRFRLPRLKATLAATA
jgi:hypothetical protein